MWFNRSPAVGSMHKHTHLLHHLVPTDGEPVQGASSLAILSSSTRSHWEQLTHVPGADWERTLSW